MHNAPCTRAELQSAVANCSAAKNHSVLWAAVQGSLLQCRHRTYLLSTEAEGEAQEPAVLDELPAGGEAQPATATATAAQPSLWRLGLWPQALWLLRWGEQFESSMGQAAGHAIVAT